MDLRDFETITQISRALIPQTDEAQTQSMETVAAVSLLDFSDEKSIQKIASGLVQKGEKITGRLSSPFYRLPAQMRFALCALQKGHWSYKRICSILNINRDELTESLWAARLWLALGQEQGGIVPTSALFESTQCPEYNPEAPWTQELMDDEISSKDRLKLQAHLMVCPRCQDSLNRTREIYYKTDKLIPSYNNSSQMAEHTRLLKNSWSNTQMMAIKRDRNLSWKASLIIFLSRPSTRWSFALGIVLVLISLL